jgi:hypothetical protein
MIFSDLPSPAEALIHTTTPCQGFAQAGNRYTLFGIMLDQMSRSPEFSVLPAAIFTAMANSPSSNTPLWFASIPT